MKRLEESLKRIILFFHQVPCQYVVRLEENSTGAQADITWIAQHAAETIPVLDAVRRCFEEAAASAGVNFQISEFARGADMRHDPALSKSFRKHSKTLGLIRAQDTHIQAEIREVFTSPRLPLPVKLLAKYLPRLVSPSDLFYDTFPMKIVYGTDLANVSQVIPAIHPYVGIGGTNGPHMAEFADDVKIDEACRAMLDGGIALAWTALDAATDSAIKSYLLKSATARKKS